MMIPDSMWVTILVGGVVLYIDTLIHNGWDKSELISRIIGALAVSVLFFLVDYLKPDSIGGGDIKLMFAAGFALGWVKTMFSLLIAGLVGTVFLLVTNSLKKENMKKQVPFGPHLAVGIFVAMLFGDLLIKWYMAKFGIKI